MAVIDFRFGTDDYKKAKTELQGYKTQLGELTQTKEAYTENKDLQVQEYNDATTYDIEYAKSTENLKSAEDELNQLNADLDKLEQSAKKDKDGKIISYTSANGENLRNNEKATEEYDKQKSLIEQKIKIAKQQKDFAIQEQTRIEQERSQKHLKETEIEKYEADISIKELDDLNKKIDELNLKISPLETAIKNADEDKVDVAVQNNKNWDFYAKKELEAEGIENPSKTQIQERAEEIKQRNIDLNNCDNDGNLIVGKSVVTLTGKSAGVADGLATKDEAVGQYTHATAKKASTAIESALGQLSQEEKIAYDSLSPEKKSQIQSQVLNSINNGNGDNALSFVKQAVSSVIKDAKATPNTQKGTVLQFSLSLENTMLGAGYFKTFDGNYQKGDKLYKATGDIAHGVVVTEIGNAQVANLVPQQQTTISENLNTCRNTANNALAKANDVIKHASATGMLNGLMFNEYHTICEKNTKLSIAVANLGTYDTPNVSNQINKVNTLAKELNSLCDAYKAKDKGMSESYYSGTGELGAIPGQIGIVGNVLNAMGAVFDEFHTEDSLTMEDAGKVVLNYAYGQFGGNAINKIKIPYVTKIIKEACGNNFTKAKILEYLENKTLDELKNVLGF